MPWIKGVVDTIENVEPKAESTAKPYRKVWIIEKLPGVRSENIPVKVLNGIEVKEGMKVEWPVFERHGEMDGRFWSNYTLVETAK